MTGGKNEQAIHRLASWYDLRGDIDRGSVSLPRTVDT